MKKYINKIKDFIIVHPIWSMIITWLIMSFVEGYDTREWNFLGCWFTTLFIFALAAPFIRKARAKRERKEELDYLAKKIAEEQGNTK